MDYFDPFSLTEVPRRVMPLIFLVDTSGSMAGSKIAAVNAAVRKVLNEIDDISKYNSDAQIKIAVLEFSSEATWMYPQLMEASNFVWKDLKAGGMTYFDKAFEELNCKLSRSHGFMIEPGGMRAPAIILLSDGASSTGYSHSLAKLKNNQWFKTGIKIAISIGDDANNIEVLQEFTGNIECVITVHTIDQLKNMIRTLSITSSMIGSQSAIVGPEDDEQLESFAVPNNQVLEAIKDKIGKDTDLQGVDLGSSTRNQGTDDWEDW